jgi:hypothetical protein
MCKRRSLTLIYSQFIPNFKISYETETSALPQLYNLKFHYILLLYYQLIISGTTKILEKI